jgi:hypothetical protein
MRPPVPEGMVDWATTKEEGSATTYVHNYKPLSLEAATEANADPLLFAAGTT